MYRPSLEFDRTPEERRDPFKSWARDDQAFFAAGACHILADLFLQLHQGEGYKMIYIKPTAGFTGNHVYVSDGEWAFDHNGWTREVELLRFTEETYKKHYPGWGYGRIEIEHTMTSLEEFCEVNNHRLPWQYAYFPWERAYTYINQFESAPPGASKWYNTMSNSYQIQPITCTAHRQHI